MTRPKRRRPAEKPAAAAVAEATVLYDASRSKSALPLRSPHLLVTAGPRKGMEIPLGTGVTTTIGRGEENTVVIPDISVSRQHVSLSREHERFVLYDQGSGNGTLVNGKRVERHVMSHFDELTLGDTKARFVELPGAPPPPPRAAFVQRSLRAPIGLAVLLVLACGGVVLWKTWQRRTAAAARARIAQTKALAQRWFQEGSALGKENQWPEALDKLKVAAELDGQDAEIRRAIEGAGAEIGRVRVEQVQAEPAQAAAAAPESLQAKAPRQRRPLPEPQQPPDVQKVLTAYLAGDLPDALEQAARSLGPRGPPLLEQLRRFEASRRDGLAFAQEEKLPEALQALKQAQAEDRAIAAGSGGRLGRELRKSLSQVNTRLAMRSAEKEEGLPAAANQLRAALREDPANEAAAKALEQIGERCQELYLRGYVSKEDDVATARAAFKLVAAALPADDPTAQKAQRWLDKLDGKPAGKAAKDEL